MENKPSYASCISDAVKALGIDPGYLAIVIIVLGCLYFVYRMQKQFNDLEIKRLEQWTKIHSSKDIQTGGK